MRKVIELQAYTESLDSDEFSHRELELSRQGKDLVLKFPYWDLTATVTAAELLKAVEDLVDAVPSLSVTQKWAGEIQARVDRLGQTVGQSHHKAITTLSERLAECERLLTLYGLDIENVAANVDALVEENKLQGTINASLQGQISGISERVTALRTNLQDREDKEALDHVVSLYGGEQ